MHDTHIQQFPDELGRRKQALNELSRFKIYLQSPDVDVDDFSAKVIAHLCFFTKCSVFTAAELEGGLIQCKERYADAGGKHFV
jgi:hypothetical protein